MQKNIYTLWPQLRVWSLSSLTFASMDFISYDEGWINAIPTENTLTNQQTLDDRLRRAYQHSATRPLAREDTQRALAILAQFGLVVEKAKQSSVPLAKYIVETLLNYGFEHGRPCEHGF